MDTQEDEDLYPPTYNAGRYEQAECVHHIHVQSIKQEPPPPPSLSLKQGQRKEENWFTGGGNAAFLCCAKTSEAEFRKHVKVWWYSLYVCAHVYVCVLKNFRAEGWPEPREETPWTCSHWTPKAGWRVCVYLCVCVCLCAAETDGGAWSSVSVW